MVEMKDYHKAFKAYRNFALENVDVLDVLQCGSINNPGVSDIDTILVINKWNKFHPSIKLLNPERFSPLFTHGPFICEKASLDKLLIFTTLKIYGDSSVINHPTSEVQSLLLISTLIRQIRCFIHFNNVKNRLLSMNYRQILLITKSLTHSFTDLKKVGLLENDQKYILLFDMLKKGNSIFLKNNSVEFLTSCFVEYVDYGIEVVSTHLERQLKSINIDYNGRAKIDMLRWFQTEVDSGKICDYGGIDSFNRAIIEWKDFYNEMSNGYIDSGAQWKGAEFVFMNFKPYGDFHPNFLLRRIIKHSNMLFCNPPKN